MECKQCGKEFVGRKREYCDAVCRYKARYPRPVAQYKECVVCGGTLTTTHNNGKKYCSTKCSARAYNRRVKASGTILRSRETYKCIYCGVEFRKKTRSGDNKGKYCSRECAFKDSYNRFSSRRKEKVGKYYIGRQCKVYFPACVICGKQYTARIKHSACCSDRCSMTHHAMNQAKKERGKEYGIKKKCRECGKEYKIVYGNKLKDYCSKKCSTKYCRRVAKHTRRARSRKVPYESYNPLDVLRRDKWTCRICGLHTPKGLRGTCEWNAPEVDHIVPYNKGGHDVVDNVQCACRSCNQRKHGQIIGQLNFSMITGGYAPSFIRAL